MDQEALDAMVASLPEEKRTAFLTSFESGKKNPVLAFILSFFLGYFGVDRFYVGDTVAGILKIVTIGGLGLWYLLDLVLIIFRCKKLNMERANTLYAQMK